MVVLNIYNKLSYYVQDASLFRVYLPLESSNNSGRVVRILSFSPEILTVYTKLTSLCWIYFSTPVKKIVLKSVFGYFVMMFIFLVFVVQKVLSAFVKKNSSVWKHVQVSLVQGLILCVLFSFQQIIKGSFSLIQCVEIDSKIILYIQGNINCNTWWQISIKIFLWLNVVLRFL